MKKRESGLDLLKVIASIFVVIIHVIGNALNHLWGLVAAGELVKDFSYYFFIVLRTLSTWAVPMFIMASGAFVLASSGTKDYRKFYSKAMDRIVKPTIIFSLIYTVVVPGLYYSIGYFGEGGGAVVSALKSAALNLAKGVPAQHMWYMFTLIVLYLLSPFVVSMREMLGERNFAVAAVVLTVWGVTGSLRPPVLQWDLGFGMNMLGIFMLGYVIRQRLKGKTGGKTAFAFFLAGLAVGVIQVIVYESFMPDHWMHQIFAQWVSWNPLNIMMAGCFFAMALTMPLKADFGKASALTYWVYLAHPLLMIVVYVVSMKVTGRGFREIGVAVPEFLAEVVVVSCLSYALAWVIERVLAAKRKVKKR